MARGKGSAKAAPRAIRTAELAELREAANVAPGADFKSAVRLIGAVPRLIAEIDRLRKAVEERDERLARIAGATKRPTKKRGPRKVKDVSTGEEKTPDSTDPAQLSAVETSSSGSIFPDGGPTS